jgi:hypothetical protein
MNSLPQDSLLRFVPLRLEGIPDVTEAAIYPDRLELVSAGKRVAFRFRDMAHWPQPAWFWRFLSRFGVKRRWLPVADRFWSQRENERFIRFYAQPAITIYIPDDPGTVYHLSLFRRIQNVIAAGGYSTFDLG